MRALPSFALAALLALALLLSPACRADEEADQIQKLLTTQAPSVTTVKIVLKTSFSVQGQSQEQESRQELQGVVVSEDGLIMLSNASFSSDRMKDMMSLGGGGGAGMEMKMTPTDFKIVIEKEDREYKGFLAATDAVLGLAFVKVEDLGDRKLTPVLFTGATEPIMGQKLLAINRLSKGYDYAPYYNSARLSGQVSKPRKAYMLDGSIAGLGLPVYTLSGDPVGILTVMPGGMKEDIEGSGGFSTLLRMLGGGGGSVIHTFLLPNASVNAVITQARQRAIEVGAERAKKKAATPAVKSAPAPARPAAPTGKPKA